MMGLKNYLRMPRTKNVDLGKVWEKGKGSGFCYTRDQRPTLTKILKSGLGNLKKML